MFKFSIKNLLTRKSKFLITTIAIIISTLIIMFSFNVAGQINDGIVSTASYYDLVVGAPGSSTDLVMSTMFFTGTASDTIDGEVYEELLHDRDVREVVPFATGDNYKGSLIVGTEKSFLSTKNLKEGKYFEEAFEIVLGSNVAKENNLSIGDKVVGSHGIAESAHSHENKPYTVVGILEKTHTAYDNTLFTKVDSVWKTHSEHEHEEVTDEVIEEHENHGEQKYTAILVKTSNPSVALNLISELNKKGGVVAVNPSTVLRDLLSNIDLVKNIVYILCAVIGVMSFVIIYMINLMMMQDVKKDVLLMRLLGLQRKNITGIILIQNIIVSIVGVVIAFIFTRLSLMLVNNITAAVGIVINYSKVYMGEYLIMGIVVIVSLIPTLISLAKMFERSLENEK
ncbi:MAG: ABC transporter permease [Clostridia bacterium]|nr:ABC transporter permease [Clostridia bacterium]